MLLPLQLQLNLYEAPITRDSKGVWTRPDILTPDIGEVAPEWQELRRRMLLAINFPHSPEDPFIYDVLTGRIWPMTISGGGTTTVYDENRGYLLEKDDATRRSTYWADPDPLVMDASRPRSFSMLCRTAASGVDSEIPWGQSGPASDRYQFFRETTNWYAKNAGTGYAQVTGLTNNPDNAIEHYNCSWIPTTGTSADVLMWLDGTAQSVSYTSQSLINEDSTVDFGHIGTYGLSPPNFDFRGGYFGAWVYDGVHTDAEALRLYYDPWGPVRWSPKSYVSGWRVPGAPAGLSIPIAAYHYNHSLKK